jgi:hypothetical protein
MRIKIRLLLAAVLSMLLFFPVAGLAASSIVSPFPGYSANDVLTSVYPNAGFDVYDAGGTWQCAVYSGATTGLNIYNMDGSVAHSLGTPTGYSGWNSFVRMDPSGDSVWVGYTVSGNSDDRIYHVDIASSTWTQKATLGGNFDLEWSGSNAYVSGLNGEPWGNSAVWLLDTSGSNSHTQTALTGGNSAGLAFDSMGNLYYGSNGLTTDQMFEWTAAQVAAGGQNTGTATILSDLEAGAYDTTVGYDDQVFFKMNGYYSLGYNAIAKITGKGAGLNNYDYVGLNASTAYPWFTFLDYEGEGMGSGGALYATDYSTMGVAQVVPIPGAVWLLGSGLLCLVGIRRRIS